MEVDKVANMVANIQFDKVTDTVEDITDVTMTIGDTGGDGGVHNVPKQL